VFDLLSDCVSGFVKELKSVTSNIKNVAKVDIQQNAHRYTLVTDFQTFLKCLILQSEEYKQGACPEFQDVYI